MFERRGRFSGARGEWFDGREGAGLAAVATDGVLRSQALGASLFNRKGDHVGNIKNILFDENLGGMTHAVLSAGAYPGMGDRMSPVPWHDITDYRMGKCAFLPGAQNGKRRRRTSVPKG